MEVEKGTAKGAGICGIILMVSGIASTVSGSVWVSSHGYGGYGIWSGIGLVIAGILGIVTWWKRNKGVLIGFLVITIIMVIVASSQAITSGVSYGLFKAFVGHQCYDSGSSCICGSERYDRSFCGNWNDLMNALLTITIFNVVGAVVSLAGSIFGCMGTCCATTQRQPGTVMVQQPVFVTTTTQPGYVAQQPGYVQQQPGYVQQQPGYVQQQPGYVQQQPGYAPQPAAAYPPQAGGAPPQYTKKY
uniref:Protein FAM189B-like isoform X2 n=1 Tax=Actinia tenebrosa TaxID=6105 RepID=A0A6P8HLT2_ACTTE